MFKNIIETTDNVKKLFEKHQDYTVLTITNGLDKKEHYEHWNIYTPIIGHNRFEDPVKLNDFIDKMLKDKSGIYRNHQLKKITERIEAHKESLENLIEDKAYIEKTLELEGE